MSNNLKKEISDKYIVSGTLGDMFIVFCKLYRLRKEGFNKKIILKHYSSYPDFYPILEKLFVYIENVEIEKTVPTSSGEDTNRQIINVTKQKNIPFINSKYDGSDEGIGLGDPDYVELEPYPELKIQPQKLDSKKFKIGIQLHSGKVGGNFKGFSLQWLSQIRKLLPQDKYDVYLFGTGGGYSASKIGRFCNSNNFNNKVGQLEFEEWLSYIKSMDFIITPEGFSAFFAMSQRIRSIVFFTDYQILERIHPYWRKENIIMSAGQETLPGRLLNRLCRAAKGRNCLFAPLKPVQISALIEGEI